MNGPLRMLAVLATLIGAASGKPSEPSPITSVVLGYSYLWLDSEPRVFAGLILSVDIELGADWTLDESRPNPKGARFRIVAEADTMLFKPHGESGITLRRFAKGEWRPDKPIVKGITLVPLWLDGSMIELGDDPKDRKLWPRLRVTVPFRTCDEVGCGPVRAIVTEDYGGLPVKTWITGDLGSGGKGGTR